MPSATTTRQFRILVVEDDTATRDLAISVLAKDGLDVHGAGDGMDALFEIARDPSIALLVTDIVMPGLDGWDLARRAKCLRPELRVVYMSAFPAAGPGAGESTGLGPLLPKPWQPTQLRNCVRRLARRGAAAQ
jgi:CheY-like chemotaxis protein